MARFTSKRLTRDVSYDTAKERKFVRTMHKSPKASGLLKEYLKKRGKRGYTKKTWNKFMRKKGPRAMSKTSRKSIESYLNTYGKDVDSAPTKAPEVQATPKKSSWFGGSSLSEGDKKQIERKQEAAQRQETRRLRDQFGSGRAGFTRGRGFEGGSSGRSSMPRPPRMPPPPPRPPKLG